MFGRLRRDRAPECDATKGLSDQVREISVTRHKTARWVEDSELRRWPTVQRVLDCSREELPARTLAVALLANEQPWRFDSDQRILWDLTVSSLMGMLLRRKAPWTDEQLVALLVALLDGAQSDRGERYLDAHEVGRHLAPLKHFLETNEPSAELADRVRAVQTALMAYGRAEERKMTTRLAAMLGEVDLTDPLGATASPWSDALRQHVAASDLANPDEWEHLLRLAASGSSSKPSRTFAAAAGALIDEVGPETVGRMCGELLSTVARIRGDRERGTLPPELGDVLRGVVWIATHAGGARAAQGLGDMGLAGWRKVPSYGPLSRKAADACIVALARMPEGASQLGRLRSLVKQPAAVSQVTKAIDESAKLLGVDRDAFEELVAPDFGLVDATRQVQLGDYIAEVYFDEHFEPRLRFIAPGGKALKSVPAAVKASFKGELTEMRAEVKDLAAMTKAQRSRVERLLMGEREWRYEDWAERFLHHGLVGVLARRLIWSVDGTSALSHDGGFIGCDGAPLPAPAPNARVTFWHPVEVAADEVLAWRVLLEERRVRQPFKQAHREVYLLTDAERNTRVYSNRYGAHILKQYQMAALARDRGWAYALQGAWDTGDEQACLHLPEYDLDAYFYVDRPLDWDNIEGLTGGDAGVFLYVLTDQVRFHQFDRDTVVELADIPPRVFSEVMRDIDLLVGVASVGNDPTWADHGVGRQFADYWDGYSFGELGPQGDNRQDILTRLLPKLAIADRCELDGRFLRVRGDLRTYKIHLGSANILMEPNDSYLCIVANRGSKDADQVFLPFEGDGGLAIILSKAFMLANDRAISDPTITSQINQR